jgi:hypothetical protein
VPEPGETPDQALERVQWGPDTTDLSENRRILAALLRSDVQTRGDFNPEMFTGAERGALEFQEFSPAEAEGHALERPSMERIQWPSRSPATPPIYVADAG